MGGKAKPTKHTAKELAAKAKDALCNRGGGSAGAADRAGGAAGHAKYQCPFCGQASPDCGKSAQAHWDSKHGKQGPFNPEDWVNKQALAGGVTTQGVAVKGGINKKHK